MATARQFKFVECICPGTEGNTVDIPAGIWPVAERDIVTVYVGAKVLELEKNAFQKLKLERKAVPLD